MLCQKNKKKYINFYMGIFHSINVAWESLTIITHSKNAKLKLFFQDSFTAPGKRPRELSCITSFDEDRSKKWAVFTGKFFQKLWERRTKLF